MTDSLLSAIAAWLGSSAEFTALVPGGISNTAGPVGTTAPYVVISKADSRSQKTVGRNRWVEWITVNFTLRAPLGATAENLLDGLRDIVLRDQPRLAWAGGRESGRYVTDGQTTGLEDGLGIDGGDVWTASLPIIFVIARG